MKNKKGAAGLITGLVKLIGGAVFIWLLITFFSTGASFGFLSSKPFIILIILFAILWMVTKRK